MFRKRLSVLVMVFVLGLAFVLAGCSSKDREAIDAALKATGYQGTLEDGYNFVYFEMSDGSTIISLTNDENKGDDAITYSGKPTKTDDGKITVTDEESGESITITLTENADGTATVDVDGHGKGELTVYEGNILSIVGTMANDDEAK